MDTDNGINTAIRKVRIALQERPDAPRLVATVPGRGYRFTGVLLQEPKAVLTPASQEPPRETPFGNELNGGVAATVSRNQTRRSFWWIASSCLALLAVASLYLGRRVRSKPAPASRVMLAVLPFQNLSDEPAQEYFSDGLTEETITDLGELNPEQLGVIARTSSAAYKHTNKTIAEIGAELGVGYILEGSVRHEGRDARISAQLIRVKDQVHLWAHNYDRESGGLLALQSELGSAIAQQVQVQLAPSYGDRSARKHAPKPEAYELYLKGRFLLNKRTWPEVDESIETFQESIKQDPGFALAYAGLADSYLAEAIGSQQEFDPKAKAAAARALELDDSIADAHAVLGSVKADFEYDWPGAEQEFKRAIELNPNDADAHYQYAWHYLTPLGDSEQAIAEMKTALQLDPFSRIDNTILGMAYFYARRYHESLEQFNKAIQLNPDFFVTYYHLAWLYSQLGQYPDAIAALTRGRALAGDHRVRIAASDEAALRKAFAAEGAKGYWKEMLREGDKDDTEIGEFGTAQVYARLEDKENALRWLEHNYDARMPLGTLVNVDPAFDSLRSDPRFRNIVSRTGLVPNEEIR
jgi:TolB-like protein/Tfp pilus assembly protein PilF